MCEVGGIVCLFARKLSSFCVMPDVCLFVDGAKLSRRRCFLSFDFSYIFSSVRLLYCTVEDCDVCSLTHAREPIQTRGLLVLSEEVLFFGLIPYLPIILHSMVSLFFFWSMNYINCKCTAERIVVTLCRY